MKYTHVIIGAGPSGLQMGSFLDDHCILEKSTQVCSFFRTYPRQRQFISINKSSDMRLDWNSFIGDTVSFHDYTEELYPKTDDYVRYAEDFVKRKNLNIQFNYEVTSLVKLDDGTFSINDGDIIADKVFVGIGIVPKDVPFEVHPRFKVFTYANMPLDKEVYRGKVVLIIGLGNASLETADFLSSVTKYTVIAGKGRCAYQTHFPGHLRSKNFTSVDSFFLKGGTHISFCPQGEEHYELTREMESVKYMLQGDGITGIDPFSGVDIVIFCIGFKFHCPFVQDLIELCPTSKFPLLNDSFESTITPNLFFIGANTQAHDFKQGTSSFVGGFRFNCQYISRHLKGIEPEILDTEGLVKTILRQLNTSACLLHRFDQFCDIIEKHSDGVWKYTKEVRLRTPLINEFTVRLGYTNKFKTFESGAFDHPICIQPICAHNSVMIHPIFQTKTYTYEMPEDVYNEFSDRCWHIDPLRKFIKYVEGKISMDEFTDYILDIGQRGGRDYFWKN